MTVIEFGNVSATHFVPSYFKTSFVETEPVVRVVIFPKESNSIALLLDPDMTPAVDINLSLTVKLAAVVVPVSDGLAHGAFASS